MSGPTTTTMAAGGPALPMSAETTAALLAQDPLAGLPASTHSLHMAAHQTALKHISPAAGSTNSPQSLALQHQQQHAMQQYAMQMPLPMQAMPHAVPHGTPVKAYMATAGTLAPGSVVVAGLSPASASKTGSPATIGTPQHAHHMAIPFSQLPNGAASFAQSHTSPGAPVAATVAASSVHPPAQAHAHLPNGSALAVPSGAPILARRPSAQASSTPVMATVLDGNSRPTAAAAVASHAQPHLATPANSSNGATLAAIPTATRKTSPMPKQQQPQQQQHQVAGLVTATIVDEKSAAASHPHQHAARPVPASAIGGQKVVTATIIPASVAGRMHQSIPARPIGGGGGATNNGQRQRKRSLKAGGGGGGGGRAKLSQPDALSDVEDGSSITRCICGSSEDDGFMICCEACGAWQHGDCVGLDPDHVPEEYLCDLCDPQGEIHQARQERSSLAGGGSHPNGSDSRRKRRRRGESKHISLGKKKGRRTSRTGRVVQGSYAQQEDGYSSGDGSSQHSGGSYGDSSADGAEEEGGGGPVDHDGDTPMASRSSRRSRATKPMRVSNGHPGGSSSSSGGHPLTGGPDAPHPGDSPVLESPNDDSQLLSPTLTSAAVTPAYHASAAAGHVPPLRVTSSAEGTPAASPTGETKLRSLIFFSEQLANGQMTSPISSTAGLALNQLGQPYKYTYPSFGARPSGDGGAPGGTGGGGGAGNANGSGAGGVSEDGKECFSPLILHRQVSENTANAAMMVAGFSAAPTTSTATVNASTTASASNHYAPSTHPHPPQQVKLEVFSPVLPPSLLRIPTNSEATHIPIATSTDVEAYRAHRLAQQQAKRRDDGPSGEAGATSHGGSTTSHLTLQTDASPMVASKSLFSGQQSPPLLASMSPTALLGLMSPATHAAVSTLRSVATTKKETAPIMPPRDELTLGQ